MALKPTKHPPKKHPKPPPHVGGFIQGKPPGFWVPRVFKPVAKLGRVHIWTDDPQLDVYAWLSDAPPLIDSGYGGWEEIARPGRRPVTTFRGLPGLHLTLPILFNGWARPNGNREHTTQEGRIATLEKMAGRDVSGLVATSDGEPPLVHLNAPGGEVPHQDRTWVISDLAWGDGIVDEYGDRVRQQVTLTLLEYVADVYITERSAAKRQRAKATIHRGKPGAKKKRVVAKHGKQTKKTAAKGRAVVQAAPEGDFGAGEDLLTLAARELGDAEPLDRDRAA